MIEPVKSGQALVNEITETRPEPGTVAVWWLGQSGYLIKSHSAMVVIDPYLSEHLTAKYEGTSRPHVLMTRAPLRGGDLTGVDLVLSSHKHSDHLDPGTLPDLLAASPGAVVVLPESIIEYATELGLPRKKLLGLDAGDLGRPSRNRDAEHHVVAAHQTSQQDRPRRLHDRVQRHAETASNPGQLSRQLRAQLDRVMAGPGGGP